jgi:lipase maturation factor 1
VLWQYWFTDLDTKRKTGAWWRRQELGPFSPGVMRASDGSTVLNGP